MQTVTKIVHDRVTSSSPKTMHVDCGGSLTCIGQNRDASQVVVAGRNVFKIYSVDDECFLEKYNLRVGKHVNLNYVASDIAWNPVDDNIIATGATNGAVVIWDINKASRNKQEHVFHQDHMRTVNRVCFHETEHRWLLSASQDGSMKLFDFRKKEVSLCFSMGSTGVRDVQFSPCQLNYFGFASADESGNLMIWDMRKADRCERQFPAHTGPVFSVNWHLEDKNWVATAGRDKMIKVWDISKQKCLHTIYNIASVARIKWRPQRKYHIASCSLVVDCSINIWDIRRPYVPFANFDSHKDVTTSVMFKNKDPHVMLSGSKDNFLSQHVFRDAKRPAEELIPAGLGISAYGVIGHAGSEKQGKLEANSEGSGLMSGILTTGMKKATERNDHFVDVSSYLEVSANTDVYEDITWMVDAAKRYRLTGSSEDSLCKHNAQVAEKLGRGSVAQAWLMLLTMFSTHLVETEELNTQRTASNLSLFPDLLDHDKGKQLKDGKPDTDSEEKYIEGTSGNSDDEIDEVKETFDFKLSNIARGQVNPDWDILFGDGEAGDIPIIEGFNQKQEWILPSEAFHPRHEIHDREAPLDSFPSSGTTQLGTSHVEREVSNRVIASGIADNTCNELLTADPQFLVTPEWHCITLVTDMLKNFASQGDVQTPVCMLIVMKDKLREFIEVELQEDWFFSYIDLLGRFKLWTIANCVIKLSNVHAVSIMNQQSTTIHVNCNMCNRPLTRSGWLCDRCKAITNRCAICHLPVKGNFLWCQGCSHGGHLQHMKDWFSRNISCPTGCGHLCEYT